MNVNRNLPTLSGQQNAAFDSIRATALAVTGTTSMGGPLVASSIGGGCITDSLTLSSSTTAASAHGLSNVAARVDLTTGGGIVGNLTVSGDVTCTGKFHGDGSLLTGISGGGGGGATGAAYANTTNAELVICTCADVNNVTGSSTGYGVILNETGNPYNNVGATSNGSLILSDNSGNLLLYGGSSLTFQSGAAVNITSLNVYNGLNASMQNPYNGGAWVSALSIGSSGTNISSWTPTITATSTTATFKKLYYTTTFAQTSDQSLKSNVVPLPSALSLIEQLNPVSFNWTSNVLHTEADQAITNYGFLAQDVQAVIPGLVENLDNGLLGVKALSIIPFLVKAVQELSVQVKALQASS